MSNDGHSSNLTVYILLAVVAAVALALVRPHWAIGFEVGGDIFLRLLTMMVVPLVVASVMSGIIGLGDVRKLGRPGGFTIAYYLTTTLLAVMVGLVMVNVIQPGVGTIDQETLNRLASEGESVAASQEDATLPAILRNLLLTLFTDNLILSAAETNLLPLIVFSVIFAGMLTTMGQRVAAINQMIVQVNEALLSFILLLMKVAPFGIFCLVTARFGEAQAEGSLMDVLRQTGAYFLTVLTGLGIHAFLTLPVLLWVFTRRNPFHFMYQMSQAVLTAFSTASSTATLPVTMECAVSKAGVSETIHRVRAAAGCDDQHGRHRALRSRSGDLYRPGHRIRIERRAAARRRGDRHARRDRSGRDSGGGPGHPNHCSQRGRSAGRIRRAHPVGGLAAGPLPDGS